MKLIIKSVVAAVTTILLTVSCDSNQSLQEYYVNSKENNSFISIDIPSSILKLKDAEVSSEIKNTLETIKKINFLAIQVNDSNKDLVDSEKQKVTTILKNPKYKQLVKMNMDKAKVSVSYLGDEEAIDEVVIFGAENSKGFALVRVIGENMNPSDILKLMQEIKIDNNSGEMKQLEGILKGVI